MQLSELIRRAEKELSTATRNLDAAKRRGAPEQDVRNLEAKVEYRKAVLDILNGGHLELFGKVEWLEKENAELLARAEQAERERDASIKELDDVSSAIDDLSDFIDEKIFPTVQYDIYTSLRDNADAISMWKYEKDWRGTKEE